MNIPATEQRSTVDGKAIGNKQMQALRRKLERLELEHLRQHALELHHQLEAALARIESLEIEADNAYARADMWQQIVEDKPTHHCIGINKAGEMMVVRTP